MPGAERGPGRADRWARFPGAGSGLLLALIWLVFVLEWRSGALENDASLLRLGALPVAAVASDQEHSAPVASRFP